MGLRVLIAIDASENAQRAFDFYFENLHKPENEIILVHAAEQPKLPAMTISQPLAFPAEEWQAALTKRTAEANNLEASYINKLVELKCKYVASVVYDDHAGASICKIAEDKEANFIVMGTRGLGCLRRTILGSVSDYVVHHAHIPVTICPPSKLK